LGTKLRTKSIFSREGFKNLASEKLDLEKASKSKIKCYIIATPISKKIKDLPTEFLVNGKSKETILSYLLASSAIPFVFEPVVIDGIKYMDGFGVSNTPVETLKNKGCNIIFVVPLKETSDSYIYSDNDTLIIDFVSTTNNQGIKDGTLDFVASRSIERMNIGYQVAKSLLDKLIKEKVIAIHWYQKIILGFKGFSKNKRDNYYFLSREEIEKIVNNEHM
jgi:NTE family protein